MLRRLLIVVCVLGLLGAVGAEASRRPTPREATEIRTDAKLDLQGRGWRVSAIRVSTVNGHYATAAVQQGHSGPGGEMILALRHGIWHEVFLGTDGFCTAHVPKRVLDDLGFHC
jgi:hypothetical protein